MGVLAKPVHSDESLTELFALIESNPSLWKNDSKHFKNLLLKRRLWARFAAYLQERFPMLGPFTPDNLKYVYSIKRRQYYDELKEKTVRSRSGELEYTGRWKFFDALGFLRVHSESFRQSIPTPTLNFEEEQMVDLEGAYLDETNLCVDLEAEDLTAFKKEPTPEDAPDDLSFVQVKRPRCDVEPFPEPTPSPVPRVDCVQSLNTSSQFYDECDQFGNMIANYMRRLGEEERLEFHCHIMGCTKDFFKCMGKFKRQ
ncbi:uncharacterized protein LOC8039899 [Ixodes scapularis]|uniref:uncharacterized protein LOC8039899 n=1 Tax=Ixodes scapularis TaxID=6945 RepID=UPI001A9FEE65|nr:uncharacterized protein LOC8039899 [Ixodes scapularis]